jgi:hypothetical protein
VNFAPDNKLCYLMVRHLTGQSIERTNGDCQADSVTEGDEQSNLQCTNQRSAGMEKISGMVSGKSALLAVEQAGRGSADTCPTFRLQITSLKRMQSQFDCAFGE